MSQKIVDLPGIGEVLLAKRRGTKNLRLTIQPDGKVRVGLPAWAPYSAAIKFALSRSDWINNNLKNHRPLLLKDGHRIGKSYRLQFISEPAARRTYARLGMNVITVTSHLDYLDILVQKSAGRACEKALKREAEALLSLRVKKIAENNNFSYKTLKFKRLASRWGSCSHDGSITLNYFLVQLPWDLIDYVIVHELVHTKHLNHSREFWATVEAILPGTKELRKKIKLYRPILLPN